jgi:hypothetical protein
MVGAYLLFHYRLVTESHAASIMHRLLDFATELYADEAAAELCVDVLFERVIRFAMSAVR